MHEQMNNRERRQGKAPLPVAFWGGKLGDGVVFLVRACCSVDVCTIAFLQASSARSQLNSSTMGGLHRGGDRALLGASAASQAKRHGIWGIPRTGLELTGGCGGPPSGDSDAPAPGGPSWSGRSLEGGARTWVAWGSQKSVDSCD
jgi:hypothetical protein